MRRFKFVALVCAFANAGFPHQLVVNGQFNTGDLTGWTLQPAPIISYQFVGNGADDGDPGNSQYTAGSAKHAWVMGALGGEDDVIYQKISTAPGSRYTYVMNVQGGGHLDVWWNTNTFLTFDGNVLNVSPPAHWKQYSFNLLATGSSTVIAIGGFNDGDFTDVSDVGVEAVPEPATISILGIGAFALLRRRQTS